MALDEIKQERLKKLEQLKKSGLNPYPSKTKREQTVVKARDMEGSKVAVAGRIRSLRDMGKIAFANLEDESGKIQLFFSKSDLGEEKYSQLKYIDIGDFIQAEGEVIKTNSGEITVKLQDFALLTKSLLPLPSDWYGLKDIETRLRQRYLDLILSPETKQMFVKKAKFWMAVRKFLTDEGFIEVETPALESIPGGADARPFVTHHNALDRDFYLRISLELYQKRLLVGGFEKIFEIGRIFRNEGIDAEHLQDYTQMEFYWAYADYEQLMEFSQRMLQYLVKETTGSFQTVYQGNQINWEGDWPVLDYGEIFQKATNIDIDHTSEEELRKYALDNHIKIEDGAGLGRLIDVIYKKTVRPDIIQPTFLINHPVAVSPLAKRKEGNPNRAERVQLLVGGTEASNGFSELNDPIDQIERFKEQQRLREDGDEEAQMMDMDFVESLMYGMPPAAGFGMSERFFSIMMDKPIRETVFFPPMKEERD